MTRYLRLSWPDLQTTFRVELLDTLNPELAEALWTAAPFASIQTHAVVAGKQIYCPTRLVLPNPQSAYTEPMNAQPEGRLNFEPFFQYASINYGAVSEPVPAWPMGQIVAEDLALLPELGRRIWDNLMGDQKPLVVLVEPAAASPMTYAVGTLHAAPEIPPEATWRDLLAHIETETEAIWLTMPEDVQALKLGVLASDAGVYGQYFSPWVMVTGLIRSLSVVDLAALTRLADDDRFEAAHLSAMLDEMLTILVGVIGYFGLPHLGATLAATKRLVTTIDDKEELTRFLRALFTYVNRYNLWLHHTFPWKLGTLYPKSSGQTAHTIAELLQQARYQKHV